MTRSKRKTTDMSDMLVLNTCMLKAIREAFGNYSTINRFIGVKIAFVSAHAAELSLGKALTNMLQGAN